MQAITHTDRERVREEERIADSLEREKYCIDTETVIHRKIETLKERERERELLQESTLHRDIQKEREKEREWQRVKIQGELQHQGQQ